MSGIDLNMPVMYKHSSFRFFDKNECHISRRCDDDVLVLVFDGVLRFSDNKKDYEISSGEYYIQKRNVHYTGKFPSDSPKYLYIHFSAEWSDNDMTLSQSGDFDYMSLKPVMEELDRLSHNNATLIEQTAKFFEILSIIYGKKTKETLADEIADFITKRYTTQITLDDISKKFHFSKNHIINILKKEYKMTPFEYINSLRIREGERLLEVTSKTAESIAYECGFGDYSQFYKSFKKIHNISPVEWRKNRRIQPSK